MGMISAVFLLLGLALANQNIFACFAFIFLGSVALNLNWSIIADMLLYIVTPTCRSTAEALQILASHAFGDAGSPYLIGLISDSIFKHYSDTGNVCPTEEPFLTEQSEGCVKEEVYEYQSLLYSLMTNIGVEFVGGILFFITAIYIVKDKLLCETAAAEAKRM